MLINCITASLETFLHFLILHSSASNAKKNNKLLFCLNMFCITQSTPLFKFSEELVKYEALHAKLSAEASGMAYGSLKDQQLICSMVYHSITLTF